MDATTWQRLEDLFGEAVELPAEAREAFTDRHCADDPLLRDELRSLLAAHDREHGVLDQPPSAHLGHAAGAPEMLPEGTRIGAWRVGALIGIGGSGEVYFATRADGGFEQLAAIKRLYREASPDVQRFAMERQILASLEHPGIARLLDGGVATDGRLYAIVEYVDGSTLTAYCRETQAALAARLALFLQVCDVVAYAHRNLVVHRDLKPGNVLVSKDGRVKLLDFGVAKRIDLDDGVVVDGTTAPFTSDYAAPEQLTGQPITTATDVYALGVILFELLTGERPWRSEGMPLARIVHSIVHGEPPSMSSVASERRGPVPGRLLVGDLDAIVMTCLRKEPGARYASVDALRRDLERHLGDEPVAARGRARSYVLGRALRRYRWPVAAGVVLVISLSAGLAATLFQAHRAELERDAARQAATREETIRDQLITLFRSSVEQKSSETMTARAMLDASAKRILAEYHNDPPLNGKVIITLADLYNALQDFDGQSALLESYLATAGPDADPESLALARQRLALVRVVRGQLDDADRLLGEAERFWARTPDRHRVHRIEAQFVRGELQRYQGDLDGAIATDRRTIADLISVSGPVNGDLAILYNSLAVALQGATRFEEALTAYRSGLDVYAKLGQADSFNSLVLLGNVGFLEFRTGHLHRAESTLKSAVDRQRSIAGDSATVASSLGYHGATLIALARPVEAIDVLRPSIELAARFVGPSSPMVVQNSVFLIDALVAAGKRREARELYDRILELSRTNLGEQTVMTLRVRAAGARIVLADGHAAEAFTAFERLVEPYRKSGKPGAAWIGGALIGCGEALLAEGRPADAVAPLREVLTLRERQLADDHWEVALARVRLGEALMRSGQPGGRELVERGAVALEAELGDAHPEVRRAKLDLAKA